jgi:hypothetical protein
MTVGHRGLTDGPIYLDYNATTPVDPRVVEAVYPFLAADFGNPSSAHAYATPAAQALHTARQQLAALIGADPSGIVPPAQIGPISSPSQPSTRPSWPPAAPCIGCTAST